MVYEDRERRLVAEQIKSGIANASDVLLMPIGYGGVRELGWSNTNRGIATFFSYDFRRRCREVQLNQAPSPVDGYRKITAASSDGHVLWKDDMGDVRKYVKPSRDDKIVLFDSNIVDGVSMLGGIIFALELGVSDGSIYIVTLEDGVGFSHFCSRRQNRITLDAWLSDVWLKEGDIGRRREVYNEKIAPHLNLIAPYLDSDEKVAEGLKATEPNISIPGDDCASTLATLEVIRESKYA